MVALALPVVLSLIGQEQDCEVLRVDVDPAGIAAQGGAHACQLSNGRMLPEQTRRSLQCQPVGNGG